MVKLNFMSFQLIYVIEDDLHIIQELAMKVWPQTYGSILSEKQIDYMMNRMYSMESLCLNLKNGILFYLFEYQNEIIGFTSIELNYKNANQLYIHKIYILHKFQGIGLGKLAMSKIQEIADNHRLKSILLNVNRQNPAKYFYQKLGFFIEKEEDIEIGNNYFMQDYVMRKLV